MHIEQRFLGRNLQIARHLHGLTQSQLADATGMSSHTTIVNYENGTRHPVSEDVERICDALAFDYGFFVSPLRFDPNEESLSFRKRATTTLHTKNKAMSYMALFAALLHELNDGVDLPEQAIPEIRCNSVEDIERAAEACRARWGMADRPIANVTRLAENAGAVVTRFGFDDKDQRKVDAFSYLSSRPVIVVSVNTAASRYLYDIGHELGHLVMHCGIVTGTKETENQANRFAGALLLPRTAMFREFPRGDSIAWDAMFAFKRRWRVSMQSAIVRAHELNLISKVTYQRAFKAMSAKGWIKSEPVEPEHEAPEVLRMSFEVIQSDLGLTPMDIATKLHWRVSTAKRIMGHDIEFREPPPPTNLGGNVIRFDPSRRRRAA